MTAFDRSLQPGSGFRLVLLSIAVIMLTVVAFIEPENRYPSMIFVVLGIAGIVREMKRRKERPNYQT